MMNAYGIDFGTTNSIAARCDAAGKITAFTDRETNLPHPSVIWYRGDQTIVGSKAKHEIKGYAGVAGHAFVQSIKRKLGKDQTITIFGERKPVYEIAADIFSFLKTQARNEYGDDLENVVVTVPVKFHGTARRELRKAANRAGIEISTFIHEPFAAIIGYLCSGGGNLHDINKRNILVFDWGGGTLDITIARVEEGRIYELSTAGLENIAGDHFDERLEGYSRARFLERHGFREDILNLLPGNQARLGKECERAKIELSSKDADRIQLHNFFRRDIAEYEMDEEIHRAQFEKLIQDDAAAAFRQMDKALSEAYLTSDEIDIALLIGGSSLIPLVTKEMNDRFGVRAKRVKNADTIIAEGAAIVAKNGWVPELSRDISVILSDGSHYPIFQRGHVLKPEVCSKELSFYCTDNRDGEARLVLGENVRNGDHSAITVKHILPIPVSETYRLRDLERVTAGFRITEDLVLQVQACGATRNKIKSCEIHELCFGIRTE
jgi:molecular chaperone DnaK